MLLLLIFAIFHLVNSQVALPGNCPDAPPAQTVDANEITGRWYTITRFPNLIDKSLKCVKVDITLKPGVGYLVEYSGIHTMYNTPVQVTLPIAFVTDTAVGSFEDDVQGNIGTLNVIVLKVDIDYAIVWHCKENGTHFASISWVFSKLRTLAPELRNEALAVYEEYNLPKEYLEDMDQSNCSE